MKTVCLVGGKLQGFELAYLAKKAKIKTILVDRSPKALIRTYTDEFHCFDVVKDPARLIELSEKVDALIPGNENLKCIALLEELEEKLCCPIFFDFEAYRISRDKHKSKDFFARVGVPTPLAFPSEPPYFVKPACESGSVGTAILYEQEALKKLEPSMLIEEYVEGDVVSLEIVGDGSHFAVVKETKVHIDPTYDCHKVTPLPSDREFRQIARTLAQGLFLKGIMDVEAIKGKKGLKVIEIDARFPSQTPTVVYHSTGINLLELLFKAFENGPKAEKEKGAAKMQKKGLQEIVAFPKEAYCIFEHLMLDKENRILVPVGEHVLSESSEYGKYYAEEGLEIFLGLGKQLVFTLIVWAPVQDAAEKAREKGLELLAKAFDLNRSSDFVLELGQKPEIKAGI
ncbi:MAG: 3-methylornithine--L-lysine ligase PylC [Methanosarcinaceae archaeon]|nr:3-methylornithine--L-lysine ligase PylC [Methanosarcinaceae archaeon]